MYKLTFIALVFLLSVPASAVHAQLLGIIDEFCTEVEMSFAEAVNELDRANRDLRDCFDDFDDCQRRADGGIESANCIGDLRRCVERGSTDQERACSEFLREFEDAFSDASRKADLQGLEDEFLSSPTVREKTASALAFAQLCAGLVE